MELLLWRHADAAEGLPDALRPLTSKGERQAKLIARWLKPRLPRDLRILVSPAARAQQTAKALGMKFETSAAVSTGASARELLGATGWPEGEGAVLVVGHQPTLGRAAALLLSGEESDLSVRKGALWWFVGAENGQAALRAVIGPDLTD